MSLVLGRSEVEQAPWAGRRNRGERAVFLDMNWPSFLSSIHGFSICFISSPVGLQGKEPGTENNCCLKFEGSNLTLNI